MAHTFSHLAVHVVFSTKERRPLLIPEIRARVFGYLGGILREKGVPFATINGMADHVHALLFLPPAIPLAELMRDFKAYSSGWVNENFPELSPCPTAAPWAKNSGRVRGPASTN
jgi:REP element-mobilizing transposase RayT